jgi:GTP cyclohydrolase II
LRPLLGTADPAADPATDRQRTAAIRLDRGCTELRRGRLLALKTRPGWLLAAAVETLSEAIFQRLKQAGPAARLLLSAERLQALDGRAATAPGALGLPASITLVQLQQLAAVTSVPGDPSVLGAATLAKGEDLAWSAALTMCKRARLIPALLLVALPADAGASLAAAQVLQIDPADAALAVPDRAAGLRRVSDARVPLAAEENCTLVLFRELDGDAEHVAIVVGQPPTDAPVPVRLHSACLTGDLLGSLRCDCGPQLQRAVARLAETGGVLLYLAQEGRGTGLANKLRAYRLQDAGLDTLQADRHLGFREDERDFAAAAAMLRALGHTRIQLLTNNPQKIAALRQTGIEVVDRLPLHGGVNTHNERYIRTKQQAGHLGGDD